MSSSSHLDNIAFPIDNILDGVNYNMWTQNVEVFLHSHKMWHYVLGDIVAPKQEEGESTEVYASRLEYWHSVH